MKLNIVLASLTLLFAGCAAPISKHNLNNIPESQLAVIKGTENDMKFAWALSDKIFSRIAWVYDKDGKKVIERGWQNTWGFTEIKLEPGVYIFVVYCGQGDLYATPQVASKVEENKEYIASCEKGGNSKELIGRARAYIHEVGTTTPNK